MREVRADGRYAMFLRKSREDVEAERDGKFETLAKHRAVLERLASSMGAKIAHVYEEIVSGGDLAARADAQEMLEDVRAGMWDGVFAFDLQRVTRGDMIDQGTVVLAFQLSRTLIITPNKVYDLRDELDGNYAEMEMLFGRMELARITRRLKTGKEEAVRQGQYIGSFPPYGWDKAVIDRKKTLVPNADNPRMVSWYERIADGSATPHSIANEMNDMGVPSPRGKTWDHTLVRRVIQNPVNKGFVRWNNKRTVAAFDDDGRKVKTREKADEIVVPGIHAGTVPDGLWQRANDAIQARVNPSVRFDDTLKDPLATLLVCSGCGRSMKRVRNSRYNREYYSHSPVNRKQCWQRGAKLEAVVEAVICALEAEAASIDARLPGNDGRGTGAALLQADLENEEKSLETLFRLVEKGMISDDEFAERRRLSDERRSAIMQRMAAARQAEERAKRKRETALNVKQAVAELRDYKGRAEEVNRFLKTFIDRIEYERDPETDEIHLGVFFK